MAAQEKKDFAGLQAAFIQNLKIKNKSPATILAYSNDIKQLADFLAEKGKLEISTVTTSDIEQFKDMLAKNKYSTKSIARKLNAIKAFWRWLVSKKFIENDVAAPVAHPKYSNPPPRILSRMEYRALRDAARNDKRVSAIIELMLQTGIRISEISNLRLEDISKDKIIIRSHSAQPTRILPLNKTARQALDAYLAERQNVKSNYLFVTKTGRPLLVRNIRSQIDHYFDEAGIENARVNDLRNTFIVHQLKAGVDIITVSRVAGHKRLSTTEHYLACIDKKPISKTTKLAEL
jgi:site-specific recombinase XerD